MAKVNNKTRGFGSIPRDLVYDDNLSDRARFLYVYMAMKPDGWEFFQEKMAKELHYTRETLRKYLDELIVGGWITEHEQTNGEGGKFTTLDYTIEIEKNDGGKLPIRKNTDSEKTRIGKFRHKEINSSNTNDSLTTTEDKEIKKKPTNVGKKASANLSLFPEQSEAERKYIEYMKNKYPYIMKMDKPLTMQQAKTLKEDYGEEIVLDVFGAMNNKRTLLKDYRSAYETAINWCKRRLNDARP